MRPRNPPLTLIDTDPDIRRLQDIVVSDAVRRCFYALQAQDLLLARAITGVCGGAAEVVGAEGYRTLGPAANAATGVDAFASVDAEFDVVVVLRDGVGGAAGEAGKEGTEGGDAGEDDLRDLVSCFSFFLSSVLCGRKIGFHEPVDYIPQR